MQVFKKAKWLWCEKNATPDSYGEFLVEFEHEKHKKNISMHISADSDYAIFINGNFVANNQYSDFEYFKVYDTIDITDYLIEGKNVLAVLVWYVGVTNQKYMQADAGLIFEVFEGEKVLLLSDEKVLSRKSLAYKNGRQKRIGIQIGFSFYYDATKEDDWLKGNKNGFLPSVIVNKRCDFVSRPNKKLQLKGKVVSTSSRKWHSNLVVTVDLGKETVGLPYMEFNSTVEQKVIVVWSESLSSGNVRRYMGGNEYSFEYIAKKGKNIYFNPFLKIGCRYMAIESETEIQVDYLGVKPFVYPLIEKEAPNYSETDLKIYRLCVDTLKLCALERPVDCPFREQGFYSFDTRNQMLASYPVFNEYEEYAKANLLFMAMDRRKDNLLSITTPGECVVMIPTYSLYYVISVWEYMETLGIYTLDSRIVDKINSLMQVFSIRLDNGLIKNFRGEDGAWNFYDWSSYIDGNGPNRIHDNEPDLIINCLYVMAYKAYSKICNRLKLTRQIEDAVDVIIEKIRKEFYNEEKGVFTTFLGTEKFTQLGNSLAIIVGVVNGEKAAIVCENMINRKTTESSLAMKPFYYDALLKVDEKKYASTVLKEIRDDYMFMISNGATSVWETIEGDVGHNSLCHAWNSYPIYYFDKLLNKDK